MRVVQRLQLVFLVALAFSAVVVAKCPTGTVTIKGRIVNLPPNLTGVDVMIFVHDKKGTVSRATLVSQGEFTVDIPFSTTSSSSLLLGDRCKALPKFVEIKVVSAGKVYVQKTLDFKHNFRKTGSYEYRLKQELSLNVPKEEADSTK